MGAGCEQNILETFKSKISECIIMVGMMSAKDRISAVEFWNSVSEKLQEVIDNSIEEIEQLELELKSSERNAQGNGESTVSVTNEVKLTTESSQQESEMDRHQLNVVNQIESVGHLIGVDHQYHFLVAPPPGTKKALVNDEKKSQQSLDVDNDMMNCTDSKSMLVTSFQDEGVTPIILGHDGASPEPLVLQNDSEDSNVVNVLGDPENEELNESFHSENLKDESEKDVLEHSLSGQVLIVGENNLPRIEDISPGDNNLCNTLLKEISLENGCAVGKEITVTGEDGLKHKIQFEIGNQEESEEEIIDDVKSFTIITPEMAGVQTVSIDGNPPAIDESSNKVTKTNANGTVETYYQCEICQKSFITSASLTSHRWQHTKPFQCEQCNQRFASKGNLVIHRRRHTGEKPYGCHLCDSKFSTKGNLKRHTQTHSGIKPWACNLCEGRFTEKKSLKIHMRKHTGERPYVCRVCGKRFAQTSILRSHHAMHLDKRSHLCDLCGRSFRQKSQLRLHVQRHTGVKRFNCSYCESKFLTKGDLERHIKSHMGTRDFSCTLCSKTFTRQQTLNEHMNRHYGLRPYECKLCGKTFSEMSTVYKHLKCHEKDKGDDSSEDHIIIHDLPASLELGNIVHHSVVDPELHEINSSPLENVVDCMESKINDVCISMDQDHDEREQYIYLETTKFDGSISITEATVDHDGNLRLNDNNDNCA